MVDRHVGKASGQWILLLWSGEVVAVDNVGFGWTLTIPVPRGAKILPFPGSLFFSWRAESVILATDASYQEEPTPFSCPLRKKGSVGETSICLDVLAMEKNRIGGTLFPKEEDANRSCREGRLFEKKSTSHNKKGMLLLCILHNVYYL